MIHLEEITTTAGLEALAPEWSGLWDRCLAATPFQSPEWLLPWWHSFCPGQLESIALRSDGRLIGLAPLYSDGQVLRLLGTGISDYLDFLIEPEFSQTAISLVLEHLVQTDGWQQWNFEDLRAESALLAAALPAGLKTSVEICEVCPVVNLPGTNQEFLAGLGRGLRHNLRRYRERLAGCGEVRFQAAAPETLAEYLDALFRLHRARWALRNGSGVLADARVQTFHRQSAERLLRRGWLRLLGLRHNGALAAVQYMLASCGRAYLYLAGFEPGLTRFSPGALLLGFAMEDAIRAGLTEADLLRGNEPYKYLWGARDRPIYRFTAQRV